MKQILSEMTVEVTQRCPNHCLFCSSLATENSSHFIALNEVLSLGRQAYNLGLRRICISGGEPLCHPDIVEIVNGLANLDLNISLYTTGLIFNNDHKIVSYQNWTDLQFANPIIIFNIQSTTTSIHDQLVRHVGAFDKTKESMLLAQKKGFPIEVHIVPNKVNLHSLESTVSDLIDWGVTRISFLRLVYQGYARKNLSKLYLDTNDIKYLEDIFQHLLKIYNGKAKLRFGIPYSGIIEKPRQCNAGRSKLIIRYDGKVLPCEAFKDLRNPEFILGDIRLNTLSELLYIGKNLPSLNILQNKACISEPCPAQLLYS